LQSKELGCEESVMVAGRRMTFKELEKLVLALPQAEALQLVHAVMHKLDIIAADQGNAGINEMQFRYLIKGGPYIMEANVQLLIEKLAHLPPERQAEVEDFIEFLRQQELAQLTSKDYAQVSEHAFAREWENDDDAIYDKL